MSAYATKLAEAFSARLMEQVYAKAIFPFITNTEYQGEVQQGSKVNIPALARLSEKSYTGSNLTADDLNEIVATLIVDQAKAFYFKVKTIDEYKSFIKDPASKTISQRASERKKNVDSFVLGFYPKVAAGQRIGTNYADGTVAVAADTGVVTGTTTVFTEAMVGRGFKAAGHTKWYRVKSYASATSITIEDDIDDYPSAYTGGAIAAGASYAIEANTPVALAKDTVLNYLLKIKTLLDDAEVPDENRFLVVPPVVANLIPEGTNIAISVPAVYEDLVKRGFITEVVGFKVFSSPRVIGDNTNGYHCLAGTSDWLTMADKVLEAGIEEDLIGNFGSAFKDLYIYGAKVADERRKFACELFAKV